VQKTTNSKKSYVGGGEREINKRKGYFKQREMGEEEGERIRN